MTPTVWRNDQAVATILGLKRGSGAFSRWPPIIESVRAYGALRDDDVKARSATLTQLQARIKTWRDNQVSKTTIVKNTDLVSQKRTALSDLDDLIASEWAEIRQPQPTASLPTLSFTSAFPPSITTTTTPKSMATVASIPMTTAASPPMLVSTSKPMPVSASKPIPVSASKPIPVSTTKPMAVGTTKPMAVGTTKPMAMGATRPIAVAKPTARRIVTEGELPLARQQSFQNRAAVAPVPVSDAQQKAFGTLQVNVHFTKGAYLPGIFNTGLQPGEQQGIGEPETGAVDTHNVYVVSGSVGATTSAVSGEAGGHPVVVISTQTPTSRDPNYKGGAYYYSGVAPPVRTAPTTTGSTFSFLLPLGPSSAAGLSAFLTRVLGMPVTSQEAETLVRAKLRSVFPLYFH